jgi:hypothetical protein
MGYFRFRRSFKIFPGVRWNIGKKSSSISLGGRGAHYTIGPSETRTTIGVPGTGLSYTSVNRRKQANRLSDSEIAQAVEWSKAQEKSFHLEFPDRLPNEAPATPEQLETIHGLVRSITGTDMANLGVKQAAYLIDEINREKHEFTERKVHEYLDKKKSQSGAGCLLLILIAIGVGYVVLHSK